MLAHVATAVSPVFLLGMFALLLLNYSSLPAQVPIHFGLNGQPDRYGSRSAIWLLPLLGLAFYAGFIGLHHLPGIRHGGSMIPLLIAECMVLFWEILRTQIRIARGRAQRLGPLSWLLIVAICITPFLPQFATR